MNKEEFMKLSKIEKIRAIKDILLQIRDSNSADSE